MGFFTWFGDKLLEIRDLRNKVKVLVHEAYFLNNPEPFYFIKITNLSAKNNFTITHIWIVDNNMEKEVLSRELPHKLEISDQWETFYPKSEIRDRINIFKNFRVKLSDNKVYKSRRNFKVRPRGYVA